MVVIVIIGLLATIVIINVMPATDRAAATKARADIAYAGAGDGDVPARQARYPSSDEGLQVLVPGYVRRLPKDPWGNPYRYAAPGPRRAALPDRVLGRDGREGGSGEDADISN